MYYLTEIEEGEMNTNAKFDDPVLVAKIGQLETGWASGPDIAWSLSDGSYESRSAVKSALGELYRAGVISRMYVRHKDSPMACYFIDSEAILKALEEWAS